MSEAVWPLRRALSATVWMLPRSSEVPVAAWVTARLISPVAASCSVTAAATVPPIWLICSMVLAISEISAAAVPVDCWIACT